MAKLKLRNAVEERAGRFCMLDSHREFRAAFVPDNQLRIDSDGQAALIDLDDLRSIWVKLLKGVVTVRAADWGPKSTGEHILSLLSLSLAIFGAAEDTVQRYQPRMPLVVSAAEPS